MAERADPRGLRPRGLAQGPSEAPSKRLDAEPDKLQKLSLEGNPMTGTPSGDEDLDTINGRPSSPAT